MKWTERLEIAIALLRPIADIDPRTYDSSTCTGGCVNCPASATIRRGPARRSWRRSRWRGLMRSRSDSSIHAGALSGCRRDWVLEVIADRCFRFQRGPQLQ